MSAARSLVLALLLLIVIFGLGNMACAPKLSHGAQCQEWAQHHNWEAFDAHDC